MFNFQNLVKFTTENWMEFEDSKYLPISSLASKVFEIQHFSKMSFHESLKAKQKEKIHI